MDFSQINPQQIALVAGVGILVYWAWTNRGQPEAMLPKREGETTVVRRSDVIPREATTFELCQAAQVLHEEFVGRNDTEGCRLIGLALTRLMVPETDLSDESEAG
jgi:hypothetical protein